MCRVNIIKQKHEVRGENRMLGHPERPGYYAV